MAVLRGETHSETQVSDHLHDLVDRFRVLAPTDGPHAILKSILITFPDLRDMRLIDAVQQRLKPDFIAAGLMIGQFYPGCAESGLWNPEFRPLESPIPLIAIRQMVSSDFPFLSRSPEWIEIYLRQFAPSLPGPVRSSLARGSGPAGA